MAPLELKVQLLISPAFGCASIALFSSKGVSVRREKRIRVSTSAGLRAKGVV